MFNNLSFSGSEIFLGLALIALAIVGIIAFGRYRLARLSEENLKAKHANDGPSSISSRNKYPEVDVLHNTGLFWKFGLVTVLAVAVMAFNWTLIEERVEIPVGAMEMEFDVEMEAPPQTTTPPPPPPPPPPVIEEVPSDALLLEEDVTFSDQSASADLAVTDAPVAAPETSAPAPPPPPPPPPPALEVKEIFKVVEDMPRFPGCEDLPTTDEKKACSQKMMLEYIYKNIKYPAIARDNNISGTVVIRFVVTETGTIEDAEIVRDIGGDCGKEALRIVNMMNDLPERWTPGKQRGRKVPVYFNLPVKFVLKVDP